MARLLVIDDSRIARRLLRQVLEQAGHEVIEAEGAAAGLEKIVERSPECITCDVLMPGMDGRELLDALKARGIATPVIIVTADIQRSTREDCTARGAYAIIDKPLKAQELLRSVDAALSGRAARVKRTVTQDQLDGLSELINMGVGRAASALNDLVDGHVDLSVPEVHVVAVEDLPGALSGLGREAVSSVQMAFRGSLDGSAFLVFPQPSAIKLVNLITADDSGSADVDSILSGTLTEVGNILINCVVGTLSNVLRQPLHYSPPVYEEEPLTRLLVRQGREEPLIVLARTTFHIRQMQVEGSLLLLFELQSFDSLLAAMAAGFSEAQ
jgi:chemotaxis protein CheC